MNGRLDSFSQVTKKDGFFILWIYYGKELANEKETWQKLSSYNYVSYTNYVPKKANTFRIMRKNLWFQLNENLTTECDNTSQLSTYIIHDRLCIIYTFLFVRMTIIEISLLILHFSRIWVALKNRSFEDGPKSNKNKFNWIYPWHGNSKMRGKKFS